MVDTLLTSAETGFATLAVSTKYQKQALDNLQMWLTGKQYEDYVPQITHLIQNRHWDYLLDSFYQIIPFGTGGRRGEVGIGPNRINPMTVRNSAQGHAQYLLKHHGEAAKARGVVLAYDVREFTGNDYLSDSIQNPVKNLTSRDLAFSAAEVYTGNGLRTYIFNSVRTTPELSFAIRHLKAVGGDVFSASHNPPTHNGKKVFDEFGGQLIPPHDEALVEEVTKNVSSILHVDSETAQEQGLLTLIGDDVDEAYIAAASRTSASRARDVSIVYTPLHGTGSTSVSKVLRGLGFTVLEDPKTSNPSGAFENVTFRIPNPEVVQAFETSLQYAKEKHADILIASDPDADRIGTMVRHDGEWTFLNGNEIATILAEYAATHIKTPRPGVIIKTVVTTDAIKSICDRHGLRLIDGLLIGFKYIGDVMNNLENDGDIENFLFGAEESHGYLAGNYARDKDAVVGAVWLAELAAELKSKDKTLIDYLTAIYRENGYYKNYLTEIRMLGATGREHIDRIQVSFRDNPPKKFGSFTVKEFTDYQTHRPIVSETDRMAKDILMFRLQGNSDISSIKVTIRPSGTEPKIKVYLELGFAPVASPAKLTETMRRSENMIHEIEKAVLLEMYRAIGIDFPERGFLLFWQLPLNDKLKYFEIEPELAALRDLKDTNKRRDGAKRLLTFLGANPVQKMNDAFAAEYGASLLDYLELDDIS